MPMNRATWPKDLEEGLNAHFGMAYRDLSDEWNQIFETDSSDKAFEEDVLEYGFEAAAVKAEGGEYSEDFGGQGWTARYTHQTIGLMFSITLEAIEDGLYKSQGPKYARALARAMKHTKEIKGAAVLNNAVTAGYVGGDGKTLLASDHPLQGGGTASNKLSTAADFSEAALEDILIQIRKAKDDRNVPIALSPKGIILPPEQEFNALRILRSNMRVGTADNDINAIKSKGIFTKDPSIITRLTDSDAWFVKTDAPEGMKMIQRVKIQRGTQKAFRTDNQEYKARERYSFGWTDWRSCYGSEGNTP